MTTKTVIKKEILFLIFLFLLVFFLRIPSFFEPYWYGDEGIYLTIGQGLRQGLRLYREIYDNKPPLIYWLAALAQNQTGFRLILFWWQIINVFVIFRLASLLFKKEVLAFLTALLFILLNLFLEGNIPNGEIFMILPTSAALFLILKNEEKKEKNAYFLAGVLFSIAFLFKVPAVFSFLAVLTYLIFFKDLKRLTLILTKKIDLKGKFSLLLGFSFLPLILLVYFSLIGDLGLFLQAVFKQNFNYLHSWKTGFFDLNQRFLLFLGILIGIFLLRKHFNNRLLILILWFIFDLFASLLSGRPYPHYLIQITPSLSLLLVYFLTTRKFKEKLIILLNLGLLILAVFYYHFWQYPVFGYYKNFWSFILGQKTKAEYFAFFDPKVNENYRLAAFIKVFSQPNQTIFIWGDEPSLYALSKRLPTGRYTVAYHVIDFNAWEEVSQRLKFRPPNLIVLLKESRSFSFLEEILEKNYRRLGETSHALFYQKL